MSIRSKLTLFLMLVVVLGNVVLAVITSLYINYVFLGEVQNRVLLALASARRSYDYRMESISDFLHDVSVRRTIHTSLAIAARGELGHVLDDLFQQKRIDILILVDRDGRVAYRAHNTQLTGDDLSDFSLVASVLKDGQARHGTIILPGKTLEKESPELAKRAAFKIRETPRAVPTTHKLEQNAMAIAAAVPFFSSPQKGSAPGVLFAAQLLNRRYEVVDVIREDVFHNQTYKGKKVGTATIFQGDLRISTNVRNNDGSRAIGTRLSAEVNNHVLQKGRIWADRAFVVNDWYITAYEAIRDPSNRIIGALYVGLLEKPFLKPRRIIVLFFLGMVGIIAVTTLFLLYHLMKLILRPIDRIVEMCRKVTGGDLAARVKIRPQGEMGMLCKAVDHMAEAVEERESLLKQVTAEQLGQSEKLSSIGRLAAGIAHEINNPLTGVLTFAHLCKKRDQTNAQTQRDLEVVIHETTRVRDIVRGLLDFSRESITKKTSVDINETIQRTITLVKNQKEFRKIVVEKRFGEGLAPVWVDKNQLQQVFMNILLNASEAMPDGGTLTITSKMVDEMVKIQFADTGFGIEKEHLGKIFDPFFTTKSVGSGTGLGLSVSYGIIQKHGGTISVESEKGKGTVFSLQIPTDQRKDKRPFPSEESQ